MDTGPEHQDILAQWVRRCATGDREALRLLYDREAGRLKALALRLTGSAALAEDALHDVFLDVWHKAASFDPARAPARAWLTSLTRYRALELRRRQARAGGSLENVPEAAGETAEEVFSRLAAQAEGARLAACLGALGEVPRQLILLAFLDGHTHPELAARFSMRLGTVKSVIRRSLIALRRCLSP